MQTVGKACGPPTKTILALELEHRLSTRLPDWSRSTKRRARPEGEPLKQRGFATQPVRRLGFRQGVRRAPETSFTGGGTRPAPKGDAGARAVAPSSARLPCRHGQRANTTRWPKDPRTDGPKLKMIAGSIMLDAQPDPVSCSTRRQNVRPAGRPDGGKRRKLSPILLGTRGRTRGAPTQAGRRRQAPSRHWRAKPEAKCQ